MDSARKAPCHGLLFLLSYLACVAPWIIRNYQQQGLATPSTVGRSTFTFMSERPVHIPSRLRTFSGSELNKEVTRISNEWIGQTLTPAERKHAMEQKALVLIAQHWPTVAYQTAVGVLRTCLGPGSITVLNSIAR